MSTANTGHMVDDFENAFQACLSALTNPDHFNVHDSEETKSSADQTLQRFLDMARHMECFFLQKRLLLSAQKPEQILREDINELKLELTRKEQLIQNHYGKIQYWQGLLSDLQGPGRPPQPPPPLSTQLSGPSQLPMPPQQVPNMPSQVLRSAMPPSMQPPQMYGYQAQPGNPHMVQTQMGQQSPLAHLEKTTSSIGMNDLRRQ